MTTLKSAESKYLSRQSDTNKIKDSTKNIRYVEQPKPNQLYEKNIYNYYLFYTLLVLLLIFILLFYVAPNDKGYGLEYFKIKAT